MFCFRIAVLPVMKAGLWLDQKPKEKNQPNRDVNGKACLSSKAYLRYVKEKNHHQK